jgi:N utilization substance protein B
MLMTVTHKNRFSRILSLLYLYRYQFSFGQAEKERHQQFLKKGQNAEFQAILEDFESQMSDFLQEEGSLPNSQKTSKRLKNKSVHHFSYDLISGTLLNYELLEEHLKSFLNKGSLSSIPKIEHVILLQSIFELLYYKKNPKSIIINEAIELAKLFSQKEAPGFINGILDGLAKKDEEIHTIRPV